MAAKIGVDTGGTFTDCIFMDDAGVTVYKILTTPDNPARAVLQGLRYVCQTIGGGTGGRPGMPGMHATHSHLPCRSIREYESKGG